MPDQPVSPSEPGDDEDATRLVARSATTPVTPARSEITPVTPVGGAAAMSPAATASLEPGQILPHTYLIEALLARGGMGEVYRARHTELGSLHAVKIILPDLVRDERIVQMFKHEAKQLKKIRNDAVVAYDGMSRDEFGRRYIAMEFVDGISLAKLIKEHPLTPAEVRRLRDRCAAGLAAAHEKGVYHRDISPDNIILVDGRPELAKIIDFGIAKSADPGDRTVVGQDFAGKYSYVSPEQLGAFGGTVDGRSDIYSLGLVLVAAAQGRPLDMGNSPISVVEKRQHVPDLSGVPAELRAELEPLLRPNPADRPQSMLELPGSATAPSRPAPPADDLFGFATPAQTAQKATTPPTAAARRSPVAALAVAALSFLLVVGAGAAYYALRRPAPVPPAEPPAAIVASKEAPPVQPPPTVAAETKPEENQPPASAATPTTPPDTAATQVPPAVAPPPPAQPPPAQTTPPVVTPPPQQSAALTPTPQLRAAANARLQSLFGQFQCANLSANVSDDLSAKVTGFVGRQSDLDQLKSGMAAIDGLKPGADTVAVYAWPHCAYIKLLLADASAANAQEAPRLEFNKASKVYKNGDKLTVKATAGRQRDGYLYVDYIDNGGTVVHIFPTPLRKNNFVKAGQQVSLGTASADAKADERVYEISEPFGPNLVVAIYAAKPLFETLGEEAEPADQYLRSLQAKLAGIAATPAGKELASSYSFIDTVP
jgi:tRNA A-37 threonylcarbamoyl transferase component Bud32